MKKTENPYPKEVKQACSERIDRLKSALNQAVPSVCTERAILVTEAYRRHERLPVVEKRAHAFLHVLKNMTLSFDAEEILVGRQAGGLLAIPVFPETQAGWLGDQIDTIATRRFHRMEIGEEKKQTLRKILPYWLNKTPFEQGVHHLPEETRNILKMAHPVISSDLTIKNSIGHVIADYETVLKRGFIGIEDQIRSKIKDLDGSQPDALSKLSFYRAALTAAEAIRTFATRWALFLKDQAQMESDETRRQALMSLAQICEKVPANPAETFHEALQSFWFTHLCLLIEADGLAVSPGRLDQYLYPYYQKDIQSNRLDKERALELIACLWIKFNEVRQIADVPSSAGKYTAAFTMSQNVILGGQDDRGKDATNDLSYLLLDVEQAISMPQPALSARMHSQSPNDFLMKAIQTISMGGGKPALFNDEIIVPALLSDGVRMEDALNYAIVGCVEPTPSGNCCAWTNAAMFNIAKCLELTLFNGKCALCGESAGLSDTMENRSFDDLLSHLKKTMNFYIHHMCVIINTWDTLQQQLVPLPYLSLIIDGCIENGRDVVSGGARYNFTGPQGVGVANVANALEAIRELVFEDKTFSLDQLRDVLEDDFSEEPFRQRVRNRMAKYGNNIPAVDALAAEIAEHYCKEIRKYENPRSGRYRPGLYSVAGHVRLGKSVGALPDGKCKADGLADGISPTHGSDREGLTALLQSAGKLPYMLASNGTNLNPRLHPTLLQSEAGKQGMISLLKTAMQLKIMHMQFNVVDTETLQKAKISPEKYTDLLIRVSGYSAFFVDLDEDLQNDVIGRTLHSLI